MSESKLDCRTMFRQHALDLWRSPQQRAPHSQQCEHWMLQRRHALRSWLAAVVRHYGRLRRAGADPFDGCPLTGFAVICQLGFESREEPQSLWEHVRFTAAMLVATTRESFRIQRELLWLAKHSGGQG
jgi:hypothetical protein